MQAKKLEFWRKPKNIFPARVTQTCVAIPCHKQDKPNCPVLGSTSESGSFMGGLCPELLRSCYLIIPNTPVLRNPERGAATLFTFAITMIISTHTGQTKFTSCGLKSLHKATQSAS